MRETHAHWSARGLVLLALLFSFLGSLTAISGCSDPASAIEATSPIRLEPLDVTFVPGTDEVEVSIVNTGTSTVKLENLRIEGPDWRAFTITDERNPSRIGAGLRVGVHVAADTDAFVEGKGADLRHRRGTARLAFSAAGVEHEVPLAFEEPSVVGRFVIPALVKILLLVLAFIMPLASLLTWLERKQSAMMQDRLGPNMAGITVFGKTLRLWGLLHIAADGLKMLFKEDLVPRHVHKLLYTLAPMLSFMPALVVFAIVPFGDGLCYGHLFDTVSQADVDQCVAGRTGTPLQIANLDVGLLFYFAIASLSTFGATLAGWSSYNKWALLGGLRASAQMISYEVAIGLTLVGTLLVYGSLEPHGIVRAQLDGMWGIVLQPLAFVLFFTAAIAETKRAPFDIPEGESEIIGYFVEYSGMRFGLFFLAEFIEIVFASALVVTLFFGGWSLPFDMLGASGFSSVGAAVAFFAGGGLLLLAMGVAALRASPHAAGVGILLVFVAALHLTVAMLAIAFGWGTELPHLVVVLIGMITWGIKVFLFCWLQLLIRWTLPRFRYDQLMALGWKGLLPLSLANIVLTALAVYFVLPHVEVGK